MSVIDVDGLAVEDSSFRDTAGVAPQAGVDLEPDLPSQQLRRIRFTNCSFTGNEGAGFQIVYPPHTPPPPSLDPNTPYIGDSLREHDRDCSFVPRCHRP